MSDDTDEGGGAEVPLEHATAVVVVNGTDEGDAEPTRALTAAMTPEEMGEAVRAYRQLQAVLDREMPDQIIDIHGRKFRRKGYWRAIQVAFGLAVECVAERREEVAGDWGYVVTYRASQGDRVAFGDGACFASEKGRGQRTIHNVRSHAHTRAYNRAVSNLVGFGEVSADEIDPAAVEAETRPGRPSGATPAPASVTREQLTQRIMTLRQKLGRVEVAAAVREWCAGRRVEYPRDLDAAGRRALWAFLDELEEGGGDA